jgi:hypothetical protein
MRAAAIFASCCSILVFPFSSVNSVGGEAGAAVWTLRQGDLVVFTGGEDMVATQENGYMEMLLQLSCAAEHIRYRNMAWEGDTVYEQRRDLNFASWSNQLQRVGATIVVAQFGQSESLQGKEKVSQFIRAYEKLLDTFEAQRRRVVVLSPTPFEKTDSFDLTTRNDDLKIYVEAIRDLAKQRAYPFVDLFRPLRKSAGGEPHLTRDGLHLTARGHWLAAQETGRQLGWSAPEIRLTMDASSGTISPPKFERMRQAIREKNQLWFDYWRPMNWAFLHGDRIEQPSSHDHRNPKVRWFPQEMEQFLPLIEAKEREVMQQADRAH